MPADSLHVTQMDGFVPPQPEQVNLPPSPVTQAATAEQPSPDAAPAEQE